MRTKHQRKVLAEAQAIKRAENKQRRKTIMADRLPEKKARGRVMDKAHLAFIRRLPCASCSASAPNDAAHLRTASAAHGKTFTGGQRKPDDCWTVPLCRTCHEIQHAGSEMRFWQERGVNPFRLAERLYRCTGDEQQAKLDLACFGAPPPGRSRVHDFMDMHMAGEKDIT